MQELQGQVEPTGVSEDRQDSEAKRGEEGTLEGWTGRDEGLEVEGKGQPDQAQSPSPQDRMRQGEVGEHPHSGCNHLAVTVAQPLARNSRDSLEDTGFPDSQQGS